MTRRFVFFILITIVAVGLGLRLFPRGKDTHLNEALSGKPLPVVSEGISILTWNLQWFPGNSQKSDPAAELRQISAVAAELKRADADILCLQEVKGELAVNRLLEKLPEYRMQVVSNFRGAQEVAILSKMDAVAAYAEEFAKADNTPPRGFVHAAYEFDGVMLLIYSVHLKSNIGGIEANIPKREEAARQLLRHVEDVKALHLGEGAKAVQVVLSGDFNTSLIAEPFSSEGTGQLILDAGFEWGFRGLPEKDSITWLSDGRYPDVTFDHFFVEADGGGAAGRSVVIPTSRSVSDHRPVVMKIVIPGP